VAIGVVLDPEPPVRAGRHGDLIAPRPIDEDQRGPGGGLGRHGDSVGRDAFGAERSDDPFPDVVGADAADESHLGAEPPRGDRLVGSLAPMSDRQGSLGHRLAHGGQARERNAVVDVCRADD